MRLWLLTAALIFGICRSADGIIIRHDIDDKRYTVHNEMLPALVTFTAKHNEKHYPVGSGTYIGEGWVLTAAHVANFLEASDRAEIQGENLDIKAVYTHEKWRDRQFGYDIALVKVSVPAKPIPAVVMFKHQLSEGDIINITGKGDTGNGKDGIVDAPMQLRFAQNEVVSAKGQWVSFDFSHPDDNALPLEGIGGGGDSGSPAYVVKDGVAHIVGVSSWQDTQATNWQQGLYGAVDYYTHVNHFRGWILQHIEKS